MEISPWADRAVLESPEGTKAARIDDGHEFAQEGRSGAAGALDRTPRSLVRRACAHHWSSQAAKRRPASCVGAVIIQATPPVWTGCISSARAR